MLLLLLVKTIMKEVKKKEAKNLKALIVFLDEDLEYVRPMFLHDEASETIGHLLLQAIADIERVKGLKGKMLVHCHLGASRYCVCVCVCG